jgi:hypothetical protein
MLRKLLTLVSGLLFSVPAMTQDQAQVEVFGGYSGQFFGSFSTSNLQGWNASATWKFQNHVGIAADFGGYYGSHIERFSASYSLHSFLFGPQFSTGVPRLGRLNLFAHLSCRCRPREHQRWIWTRGRIQYRLCRGGRRGFGLECL